MASAPAAAQTVTVSASGNNGDRDAVWPGLQIDEGDRVTFTFQLNDAPIGGTGNVNANTTWSGTAYNTADLRAPGGGTPTIATSFIVSIGLSGNHRSFFRFDATTDGTAEGDETVTVTLDSLHATSVAGFTIGTPSSATVTIRGTDAAPSFGMGAVSAKTFTAGAAITEFTVPAASGGNGTITHTASNLPDGLVFDATGTDTNGCPGTEAREVCGTPTTAAAQTVTITATDADFNTMNTDRATLTFSATVNAGATLASNPTSLTEDNLAGATLTVTLGGVTYAAGVTAASFELVTSPTIAGLSISTITGGATGTTTATLTLAAGTATASTPRPPWR